MSKKSIVKWSVLTQRYWFYLAKRNVKSLKRQAHHVAKNHNATVTRVPCSHGGSMTSLLIQLFSLYRETHQSPHMRLINKACPSKYVHDLLGVLSVLLHLFLKLLDLLLNLLSALHLLLLLLLGEMLHNLPCIVHTTFPFVGLPNNVFGHMAGLMFFALPLMLSGGGTN